MSQYKKNSFLKSNQSKGMTLLEMLVALGLFTFIFIFIVQVIKQSYRQAEKIKKDIHIGSSLSNTLALIRQDFQGVAYFLDINENFAIQFPIKQNKKEDNFNSFPFEAPIALRQRNEQKASVPVFLSPYFVFQGEEEEINFVSYSFARSSAKDSQSQWLNIRYRIEDCKSLDEKDSGSCLVRLSSHSWNPSETAEEQEKLILLRDFKSLKFSYLAKEDFLDKKWNDKWRMEESATVQASSWDYPQQQPFPSSIRMEMETEADKQTFFFPVSSSYLKAWNPYEKKYSGFPVWEAPKKKKETASKNRGLRKK